MQNNSPILHSERSGPLFGERIRQFMRMESSAGILLIAATAAAMLIKNSPLSSYYADFLNLKGTVSLGPAGLSKPLFLWVNDAWMAIFFFLVGMEIKREVLYGYLSQRSQIILPTSAAIGGMVVPGLIYLFFNYNDPIALKGWAIPAATDIAFALGILAMLGSRVPIALKVFLMTLAVLDDLGAIVIIALFYTSKISPLALGIGAVITVGLFALNRKGVRNLGVYVLLGMILWVCVLKSGVHATLAGVIAAFAIPGREFPSDNTSPLEHSIHKLHPWVAFLILPTFAFVNAGIAFEGINFSSLLSPLPLGIFLGLVVGKPIGILLFTYLATLLKLAHLPADITWPRLLGLSFLAGIGFTMSIFIASLAFEEAGIGYARADRLAVILASLCAGLAGYLILRLTLNKRRGVPE